MGIAYNAISSMMDNNKKKPKGLPFEVYLKDAATVNSKQELQTDIYQLLQ
jgi:effector-binding domain-containing protein